MAKRKFMCCLDCDNKAEIVKPYLERLKERLTTKEPTYNPPKITYDAGVFDAISEINTMLSELEKGNEK